jgi:hypothetical protein
MLPRCCPACMGRLYEQRPKPSLVVGECRSCRAMVLVIVGELEARMRGMWS